MDSFRLGQHLPTRLLQRHPTAAKSTSFGPACLSKLSRHPGAGRFVGSSTENSEHRVARQFQAARFSYRALRIETHGALKHVLALVIAALGSRIDQHD